MTMAEKPNDLLLLAGKVLTVIIQGALAIGSAAVVFAMGGILFFQDSIASEIAAETGTALGPFPLWPTMGLLALALVLIALGFLFFGKLRAIISSVGEGDPFVPENAERLSLMAWLLLAVQIVMIPATGLGLVLLKWAEPLENVNATVDVGLDFTGILMIIVLFILARVFKHGAAMREDLEGTV